MGGPHTVALCDHYHTLERDNMLIEFDPALVELAHAAIWPLAIMGILALGILKLATKE